jgi:hypothetical protein
MYKIVHLQGQQCLEQKPADADWTSTAEKLSHNEILFTGMIIKIIMQGNQAEG